MRNRWSGTSFLFFVVALAACGESRDSEPDTPYQAFLVEYAREFCSALAACCTAFDFSPNRCASFLGAAARAEAAAAREANYVFHPDRAERCLSDLRTQGACSTGREPASCRSVSEGRLGAGQACAHSVECVSTARSAGVCGPSTGVCEAPARELARGEECQASCQAGYECLGYDAYCYADLGLTCRDGVCQDLAPLGAPCSGFDSCVAGATCDAGTCVAQGGAGAACRDSEQCTDDHYCAGNGTCAARVPTGSPCSGFGFDECTSGMCSEGRCVDFVLEAICGFGAT